MKSQVVGILKELFYRCFCFINRIVPKDEKLIFFYDSKLMRQNCWALFRYLVENKYSNYKIVYFSNSKPNTENEEENVVFTGSFFRGAWYHLRAKYTFFEYDNFKFVCTASRGQVNFNLWHGMPLKRIGYLSGACPKHEYKRDFNYLLVTSKFFVNIMEECFGSDHKQIFIGGYPRNDQLFVRKELYPSYSKEYKNIIWMPTFRKSTQNSFSDSNQDFPLLNQDNIVDFNKFLGKNKYNLLIKLHPFQDNISWLSDFKLTNINIIRNEDIFNKGYELYEVLGQADILLTDYSSVYFDYLLLNRPVIFVFDDIDEYRSNRGFTVENPLSLMPGPIVDNFEKLKVSLENLANGIDNYSSEREKICSLVNEKHSGFSSSILNFLDIRKDK